MVLQFLSPADEGDVLRGGRMRWRVGGRRGHFREIPASLVFPGLLVISAKVTVCLATPFFFFFKDHDQEARPAAGL